jgi:hypothetical protein
VKNVTKYLSSGSKKGERFFAAYTCEKINKLYDAVKGGPHWTFNPTLKLKPMNRGHEGYGKIEIDFPARQ